MKHTKAQGRRRAAIEERYAYGDRALSLADSGCWRLPSGRALSEFALQAGFLAPLLLGQERGPLPLLGQTNLRGEVRAK